MDGGHNLATASEQSTEHGKTSEHLAAGFVGKRQTSYGRRLGIDTTEAETPDTCTSLDLKDGVK